MMLDDDDIPTQRHKRLIRSISMPDTARDPLREIRIVGRREEAPVRLLARYALLFARDAVFGRLLLLLLRWVVVIAVGVIVLALLRLRSRLLLRLRLHLPPMVRLSLLAIVHEESQGGR